jgi:hypothetical protein
VAAKKVGKNLIRKREAMRQPVQTPVPGKGMLTKSMSPNASYLSMIPERSLALLKSHSKKLRIHLVLESLLEMGSRKKYIGAIGKIFPNIENKNTVFTSCPNTRMPIGIDALNSVTGKVPKNRIIVLGDNPKEYKKSNIRSCTILLPAVFTY